MQTLGAHVLHEGISGLWTPWLPWRGQWTPHRPHQGCPLSLGAPYSQPAEQIPLCTGLRMWTPLRAQWAHSRSLLHAVRTWGWCHCSQVRGSQPGRLTARRCSPSELEPQYPQGAVAWPRVLQHTCSVWVDNFCIPTPYYACVPGQQWYCGQSLGVRSPTAELLGTRPGSPLVLTPEPSCV